MAIAFKSSGAGAGTESNGAALNLVCPATVDVNDILIAHVMHTGTATNPTTPSGWSLLYPNPADITQGAPLGTGTPTARHWAFGKLAIGNEDGTTVSFGTGGGTNGRAGRIYSFSGYSSGTLADVVPAASFSDAATETDPSGPSVTTTVAGALAIALMAQDDNNSHTGITGQSGGTWGDYLQYTNSTWGPQGIALAFNTCTPTANPGTVSGGTLAGTNDESGTIGFEIRPNVPSTEIIQPVGLASETDSALAVTSMKNKTVGLATEIDSGLAVTAVKLKAVGLASESDSALAIGVAKSKAVGLASETDTAFPLEFGQQIAVGLAQETNTAFAISIAKTRVSGLAQETDSAFPVSINRGFTLGLALETDTAFSVNKAKVRSLGLATETDSAFAVSLGQLTPKKKRHYGFRRTVGTLLR